MRLQAAACQSGDRSPHSKQKLEPYPRMRWFEFQAAGWRQRSTDKHLILSVGLVNGLRYGRYQNFEPATEARHNRGHLACRLDHLPLDKIGSGNNLIVCAIDRIADQFD